MYRHTLPVGRDSHFGNTKTNGGVKLLHLTSLKINCYHKPDLRNERSELYYTPSENQNFAIEKLNEVDFEKKLFCIDN